MVTSPQGLKCVECNCCRQRRHTVDHVILKVSFVPTLPMMNTVIIKCMREWLKPGPFSSTFFRPGNETNISYTSLLPTEWVGNLLITSNHKYSDIKSLCRQEDKPTTRVNHQQTTVDHSRVRLRLVYSVTRPQLYQHM